MKTITKGNLLALCCAVLLMAFTSCEKELMLETDTPEGSDATEQQGDSRLTILTRAAGTGTISYPIVIYIMNNDGGCLRKETLAETDDELSVKLPAGTYQVYAIGGASEDSYQLPSASEANASSEISLKPDAAHGDLMTSSNTVTIGRNEENKLVLSFVRKVLKLNSIEITDIPETATALSVSLAPLYKTMLLNGSYSATNSDQIATIALEKQADGTTWKNNSTLNLLPASGATTITVKMTVDGSTTNYIYTTTLTLEANRELNINGRYTGDGGEFSLSGTFYGAVWDEPTNISFTFNESGAEGEVSGGGGSSDETAPAIKTWYKNCYVYMSSDDDEYTTVTLLHRSEVDITGAGKTAEEVEAEINAALPGFDINGITGWRLPTEAEARDIPFGPYNTSTDFAANNATTFNSNDYYFYKEGTTLYSFVGSGVMSRDYTNGQHLRPVTTLKFRKQ